MQSNDVGKPVCVKSPTTVPGVESPATFRQQGLKPPLKVILKRKEGWRRDAT